MVKGKKMGRPPLPEHERRVNVAVRLPREMADWLRCQKNYTKVVEEALAPYYSSAKKEKGGTDG